MTDDPKQIIETFQRNRIEEDVYQAALRIWASQDSYMIPDVATCSHCGERRRCVTYLVDRTCECCECYMQRRIKELIALLPKPTAPKLDVEDFAKL